jgi:hypothetical protein
MKIGACMMYLYLISYLLLYSSGFIKMDSGLIEQCTPCSFGLISRISSHPAMFFSHNKPANSAFSKINQRNEQAGNG